ncbi:hypothetical protein SETIT_6G238100v2 [Setaria italica]|uniref:Response regulatory domain-containing protein n=1 Tax=Setaria italica TaxID=4555 RepID=A0A368RPV0_SETIT|nr:hypothetical protein SETIT_6G238100v2 [Setaria italica]
MWDVKCLVGSINGVLAVLVLSCNNAEHSALSTEDQQDVSKSTVSKLPITPRKKKPKASVLIVEDDTVRRSLRVKAQSRGFKKNSCPGRNCISSHTVETSSMERL